MKCSSLTPDDTKTPKPSLVFVLQSIIDGRSDETNLIIPFFLSLFILYIMGNEQSSSARTVIGDLPSAGGVQSQRPAPSIPRTMSARGGKLDQSVGAEVEQHRRTLFDRQFGQTEPFPGAPDNESPQWGWCKSHLSWANVFRTLG